MVKKKTVYYGIRKGRGAPVVVLSWAEVVEKTRGFSGAEFRKFKSENEASKYVNTLAEAAVEPGPPPPGSNTLWFDGGRRGSPGVSGSGAVIFDDKEKELYSGYKYLGDKKTKNEAEYEGLLLGLRAAIKLGTKRLVIKGDSMLVIHQMSGQWRVSASKFVGLHREATSLVRREQLECTWHHVLRVHNARASFLSNIAMEVQAAEDVFATSPSAPPASVTSNSCITTNAVTSSATCRSYQQDPTATGGQPDAPAGSPVDDGREATAIASAIAAFKSAVADTRTKRAGCTADSGSLSRDGAETVESRGKQSQSAQMSNEACGSNNEQWNRRFVVHVETRRKKGDAAAATAILYVEEDDRRLWETHPKTMERGAVQASPNRGVCGLVAGCSGERQLTIITHDELDQLGSLHEIGLFVRLSGLQVGSLWCSECHQLLHDATANSRQGMNRKRKSGEISALIDVEEVENSTQCFVQQQQDGAAVAQRQSQPHQTEQGNLEQQLQSQHDAPPLPRNEETRERATIWGMETGSAPSAAVAAAAAASAAASTAEAASAAVVNNGNEVPKSRYSALDSYLGATTVEAATTQVSVPSSAVPLMSTDGSVMREPPLSEVGLAISSPGVDMPSPRRRAMNTPARLEQRRKRELSLRMRNECAAPGCTTRPSFGMESDKRPTYCSAHRVQGMVSIKFVKSRCCDFEGCNTYPSYNFKGKWRARWCCKHRLEGMVDVNAPSCEVDGCPTRPYYGMEGEKRRRCAVHRLPGMVDVKSRRCEFEGCLSLPTYGYEGDIKAKRCAKHKDPGMKNIVNRHCEYPGCTVQPYYGVEGNRGGSHCVAHKLPRMVKTKGQRCNQIGCSTRPSYGFDGDKRPSVCAKHKKNGMTSFYRQKSPSKQQQQQQSR